MVALYCSLLIIVTMFAWGLRVRGFKNYLILALVLLLVVGIAFTLTLDSLVNKSRPYHMLK